MDKLESPKFLAVMEIIFMVFLIVFVAFSSLGMALAWEVLKTIQVGGTLFIAIYLISDGIVFITIILFIVRRLDEWFKAR